MATAQLPLHDARALRAVAHPLRLTLLSLLRRKGSLTATAAAADLGESSGSCSFHLRQLAKYGLVEPAPADGGRAKPWRATALATSWSIDTDDEEFADASDELTRVIAARHVSELGRWLANRREEPAAWRNIGTLDDTQLWLTPDELADLQQTIERLVEPFTDSERQTAPPAEDLRWLTLARLAIPTPASG